MRSRTNAGNPRRRSAAALILAAMLILTGCLPEAGSTTGGRDRFTEVPTMTAAPVEEPTPTPEVEQVPVPEFVTNLLDPGPTLDPTQRVFFRNGRDFWAFANGEAEPVLPAGTRFRAYATSPHGQRAAIVILSDAGGQQAESVHIIANNQLGPALTPERITTGPDAQSSITGLYWSRDATRIAVVYDEPLVGILEIARPDGSPPEIVSEIRLPEEYRRVQQLDWAVNSQAMSIVAETPAGLGSLWMASIDGQIHEVAEANQDGQRSISAIAWLPGRGRVGFVEERTRSSPATGGSMFSIAPDGSGRELLVSNGNFAPAAEIVDIAASPGGSYVAFTVNVPNPEGGMTFDSAWIVSIDSGSTSRVPVVSGFRVTDLWWTTGGLLWRAVHGPAEDPELINTYTGVEPFVLGLFNPDEGTSEIQFQSEAD